MNDKRGEWTRKGLSPLIATVLLIAFAVALGTMIMNWSVAEDHDTPASACETVSLTLQQLPDGEALCYDPQAQQLKFVVKNTGDATISHVSLRVVDSQLNIKEQDVRADLEAGGLGTFNLAYETLSPNKLTAAITPTILLNGEKKRCNEHEIERVSVSLC